MRQLNRGGALISALFIVAISAMIATALAVREHLLIHESQLAIHADHSYLELQGMQQLAAKAIVQYVAQLMISPNPAMPVVPLQTHLPKMNVDDMELSGEIADEQKKLNLNTLSSVANQAKLIALLQEEVPNLSQKKSEQIVQAITASVLKTPMATIIELRAIPGITPNIDRAIEPFLTALPSNATRDQYFLVNTEARDHGHTTTLDGLLIAQTQKDNTLKTYVVWQSFG